jgi:hypothetical protein
MVQASKHKNMDLAGKYKTPAYDLCHTLIKAPSPSTPTRSHITLRKYFINRDAIKRVIQFSKQSRDVIEKFSCNQERQ